MRLANVLMAAGLFGLVLLAAAVTLAVPPLSGPWWANVAAGVVNGVLAGGRAAAALVGEDD